MSGAWAGSTRKATLPRDWAQRVAAVKARARGRCEAAEHVPDCDGVGTDCDHRVDRHDHRIESLQLLSRPCHDAKTKAESAAGRRALAALAYHPRERHPGLL